MDVTAHKEKGISCMFNSKYSRYHDIIDVDSNHVLAAFYGILIDTAILEFICSLHEGIFNWCPVFHKILISSLKIIIRIFF